MSSINEGFQALLSVAGNNLLSPRHHYIGGNSPLDFKCETCSTSITATPTMYKRLVNSRRCIRCKTRTSALIPGGRDEYIARCIEIHGNYYNYDLIPSSFKRNDQVTIICPKHGELSQIAEVHLRGSGC